MRSSQSQSTNGNFNPQRVMTPSFHDEKHKQMLRKIEKNKKEEYEVGFIWNIFRIAIKPFLLRNIEEMTLQFAYYEWWHVDNTRG